MESQPTHVKSLADVMEEYGLSAADYELITDLKFDKVWLVKDKKHDRLLVVKRLKKTRTLFPILLHQKLADSSLLVPPVLTARNGEVYVRIKDRYFYVNEFISGLERIPIDRRIEALAAFHKEARFEDLRGIDGNQEEKGLDEFMKGYSLKVRHIIEWGGLVKNPALKETFIEMTWMGLKIYHLIQRYDVEDYLQTMKSRHSICHADYNTNNAFLTKEDDYLLMDFDFAHFGPPIQDFRFLMGSLMNKEDEDMKELLASLFGIYFNQIPEDKPYRDLYLLDSLFPHEFYRQVSSIMMMDGLKGLEEHAKRVIY